MIVPKWELFFVLFARIKDCPISIFMYEFCYQFSFCPIYLCSDCIWLHSCSEPEREMQARRRCTEGFQIVPENKINVPGQVNILFKENQIFLCFSYRVLSFRLFSSSPCWWTQFVKRLLAPCASKHLVSGGLLVDLASCICAIIEFWAAQKQVGFRKPHRDISGRDMLWYK